MTTTGTAQEIILWCSGYLAGIDNDRGKKFDLTEHREKRSLDSNSYFHVLCDKLRQKLGMSMARCKNHLIADYGQIEYIDEGEPLIYKTNAPEDRMMELETPHTKCIKIAEENGKQVYFYRVYRGSHTYNSAEMAQLIRGTVEECKAQDIETATPNELAQMAALWEKKYAQKNKENINPDERKAESVGA